MNDTHPLLRLVPRWLIGTLEASAEGVGPVAKPFSGAVLFADISGFSRLTDALFKRLGADGIDRLVVALDHTFNPLVEEVAAHGGEIAAFAGDAALAYWPSSETVTLAESVEHASRCALAVRLRMAALPPIEGVALQMRQVVTAGPLVAMRLGGGLTHGTHCSAAPCSKNSDPCSRQCPPGRSLPRRRQSTRVPGSSSPIAPPTPPMRPGG